METIKVKWFGHAMFMIEQKTFRIVTDPYSPEIGYPFPDVTASLVSVSHEHYDHNNVEDLKGNPVIVRDIAPLIYGPVSFEGLLTDHDEDGGSERGKNIIFRWHIGGITFAHMGDYGEAELTEEQRLFLEPTDVLMIPVGGVYTIDAKKARDIVNAISPRVAIPMHYKTPILNIEIDSLDNFVEGLENVERMGKTVSLKKEDLPHATEIWVMESS